MSTLHPKRQTDKAHIHRMHKLPCVICHSMGIAQTSKTEVHHIRDGIVGVGQRSGDHETISLCSEHHRCGPESIHTLGTREWERRFGTQRSWLEKVVMLLQSLE